jgi:hypothetical protein
MFFYGSNWIYRPPETTSLVQAWSKIVDKHICRISTTKNLVFPGFVYMNYQPRLSFNSLNSLFADSSSK